MLKTYISTKLAIVSMEWGGRYLSTGTLNDPNNGYQCQPEFKKIQINKEDFNYMKSKFNTYLNSKSSYISQQVDEIIKEYSPQITDAFKTLESSISPQLKNNNKLSNEDINEIYYLIQVVIKSQFLDNEINENNGTAKQMFSACEKVYYDKINDITKTEMQKIFKTFYHAIETIVNNIKEKHQMKGKEFIDKFLIENNISDPEIQSMIPLFEQSIKSKINGNSGNEFQRKLLKKCNLNFEKTAVNKFATIKTVALTLLGTLITVVIVGFSYKQVFKNPTGVLDEKPKTEKTSVETVAAA